MRLLVAKLQYALGIHDVLCLSLVCHLCRRSASSSFVRMLSFSSDAFLLFSFFIVTLWVFAPSIRTYHSVAFGTSRTVDDDARRG